LKRILSSKESLSTAKTLENRYSFSTKVCISAPHPIQAFILIQESYSCSKMWRFIYLRLQQNCATSNNAIPRSEFATRVHAIWLSAHVVPQVGYICYKHLVGMKGRKGMLQS
jgi:hypothetical protein